jgi:hypothetical protein
MLMLCQNFNNFKQLVSRIPQYWAIWEKYGSFSLTFLVTLVTLHVLPHSLSGLPDGLFSNQKSQFE